MLTPWAWWESMTGWQLDAIGAGLVAAVLCWMSVMTMRGPR